MPCENCLCLFRSLEEEKDGLADLPCMVSGLVQCSSYQKGEMLFLQGEPGGNLYSISHGVVKICHHSPDGREQIVGIGRRGNLVVGLQTLQQERYAYSATAATPVQACRISHEALLSRVTERPDIAMRLIDALNAQLVQSRALIQAMGQKCASSKLAAFILMMAPEPWPRDGRFRLPITRLEIANLLGLSEETVCRLMADLKRREVLLAPRGRIEVLDLEALRELADGEVVDEREPKFA
ncbi:Crp/Fnr family transcriptional regulator [Lentisalinibacter sediminis]|uniref:Crp/Fnr family transcriptional regulator n=1 Tax=Lentisalinibacter sediminis TaxID=2992237 RepID=UPI003865D865